jgi:hypothetical protein
MYYYFFGNGTSMSWSNKYLPNCGGNVMCAITFAIVYSTLTWWEAHKVPLVLPIVLFVVVFSTATVSSYVRNYYVKSKQGSEKESGAFLGEKDVNDHGNLTR